ncbi:CARDB domain-containing protein [Ideonella sp. A 288]|uniref:CARDB domain-containing protein n=1 Tax=Ideonella sp. A 288 TaxID=1962181 RepID=UPI000B4B41AC|nr:CARDB domain-containing protein [Ideonella sp. A 288]
MLASIAASLLIVSTQADAGALGTSLLGNAKWTSPRNDHREGQIIVKFKDGVADSVRDAKHSNEGNVKLQEIRRSKVHHVWASPDKTLAESLAAYKADPNVASAEANFKVKLQLTPNEPGFASTMWNLDNPGVGALGPNGKLGADIKALNAWNLSTGSPNAVVMVIDSGVDYEHFDLAANMWVNPGEIPGNGIDDDGNGYVDDINGIDTWNGDSLPMDDYFHGTHVAGTLGAVGNNSLGVVGVNWNVKIIACKAFDANGDGNAASILACLEYARDLKYNRGVNLVAINASFGGLNQYSQILRDALDAQRDILFVAAAGNDGLNNDVEQFFPANYDAPNLLSVAATDRYDEKPVFSHYGRRSVHIGAPGQEIVSTYTFPKHSYATSNGTSMAAPHVTGLAALLKAQDPTRDWRTIKNLILAGGEVIPSMTGKTISGRRVDAFGAMSCVNRPLFSVARLPVGFTVGVPAKLQALSINCGTPVGPVTAVTSAGQAMTLLDDGLGADLAAGDGLYSVSFTPTAAFTSITFTSPNGTEVVAAVDLSLTAVTGPASAVRGDLIAASATVANTTSTAAPESVVNFYLSTDAIITTADTLIGSAIAPAIVPGGTQVVAVTGTVPASLTAGTYYIGAIVDPANTVDEGDEANNTRAGNLVNVTNIPVDLTLTALAGPATGNTGRAVTFTATLANQGATVAPASTVNFYLSADNVITTTDVLVTTVQVPALAAGASTLLTVPTTIPVTLPPGVYYIGAIADAAGNIVESNELNNTRASATTITTSTLSVDLNFTGMSNPSTATDGASVTLNTTLKNSGTTVAPTPKVRWYLSLNNTLSADDFVVGETTTTNLNANSSRTVSRAGAIPATIPTGLYYVIAQADPDNALVEFNEANNIRVGTTRLQVNWRPDLVITAITSSSTALATGQTVTFTGTLKNQGLAAISAPINVGIYASTDTIIGTGDRLIGTVAVPSIAAGASVPFTVTTQLRTNMPSGNYTLGAFADYDRVRPESNENNNGLAGSAISIVYGPDFVISAVAAPATITRGQSATFTATLLNQGVGGFGTTANQGNDGTPNPTSFTVGIYLSSNSTITANDRRLGTATVTAISAGQSIPLSVTVTVPTGVSPGTYYIGAIADDGRVVREPVEVNNATAGNTTLVQ